MQGSLILPRLRVRWELLSEPQWTSEHGYRGVRIAVRNEDENRRELILEYPFPKKRTGVGLPQLPQRPQVNVKQIEVDVRRAMAEGWDPESRGKAFVFHVPKVS